MKASTAGVSIWHLKRRQKREGQRAAWRRRPAGCSRRRLQPQVQPPLTCTRRCALACRQCLLLRLRGGCWRCPKYRRGTLAGVEAASRRPAEGDATSPGRAGSRPAGASGAMARQHDEGGPVSRLGDAALCSKAPPPSVQLPPHYWCRPPPPAAAQGVPLLLTGGMLAAGTIKRARSGSKIQTQPCLALCKSHSWHTGSGTCAGQKKHGWIPKHRVEQTRAEGS